MVDPDTASPSVAKVPVDVPFPKISLVANALVDEAIDANRDVVVAFVTVAFPAVMLPVTVRLPSTVDDACDTKPDGRRTVMVVVGAR